MSTATEKKQKTYILTLPTELLQQVAGLVTAEDLVALRLTCKAIEAASLDIFAKEYISRLECFILDSQRLRRIQNIMTTGHLATRVCSITFSLSACESNYEMQVVPPAQISTNQEMYLSSEQYAAEQYELHECIFEGISTRAWKLVRALVDLAAQQQQCCVGIDVVGEDQGWHRTAKLRPQLTKELLDIALASGCKVDALSFSDQYPLQAVHFTESGIYHDTTCNLRSLAYYAKPQNAADLSTPWSIQHWYIVTEVLKFVHCLQDLTISIGTDMDHDRPAVDEAFLAMSTSIFSKANLRYVRKLDLQGLAMHEPILHHVLDRCSEELRELTIGYLTVFAGGDVFASVLRSLSKMPRLEKLDIWQINRRWKDESTGEEDFNTALFLVHAADSPMRSASTRSFVGVDARPFIELNLSTATEYYDYGGLFVT